MAAWSKEQEEHEDILKQASSHEESIKNMKAKIENEKKESEKATQTLFSDIESELHKE